MTELLADIASEEQRRRWSGHGWALNSQGHRLLWLPVKTVVGDPQQVRRDYSLPALSEHQLLRTRGFPHILTRLVRILLNLAQEIRQMQSYGPNDTPFAVYGQSTEHVEWAYIYARRLADFFTHAAWPVLFERHAPRSFREWVKRATNDRGFMDLRPLARAGLHPTIVDARLRELIRDHRMWFDTLAGAEGAQDLDEGIRVLYEHDPSWLIAHGWQWNETHDGRHELHLYGPMTRRKGEAPFRDLIATLEETIADMCMFFAGFVHLAGHRRTYNRGHLFFDASLSLTGNWDDRDLTRFWPEI
jgi:hypothetical protein